MLKRAVPLLALALLQGCSDPPKKALVAPPPIVATASPAASSVTPPPPSAPDGLDLSIAFHPGLTTNIGWAALPEPLPLYMLGAPGVSLVRGAAHYADTKLETYELESFAFQLTAVELEKTSLELQESTVCSKALQSAVEKQRPERLLINVKWGLTDKAVSCLNALPVQRFYLTGCLERSHRSGEQCDGDAELAALIAEPAVRERIHGLALSLSKVASVRSLAKVPTLEYLAVVTGRDPELTADFDALPFEALKHLRYLDVTNWNTDVWAFHPALLAFLGRLHTLRWNGKLKVAIPDCKLRRLSQATISDDDLVALSGCTQLIELSTDSAWVESAPKLAKLTSLKQLHLRGHRIEDLTPLVALQNLTHLDLPATDVKDHAFVARLPKLEHIDLSQTELDTLDMLAPLTSVKHVDVSMTKVHDLQPIAGLKNLVELDVGYTLVTDISVVSGFRALDELSISETAVSNIQPLAKHPTLTWVIIRKTKVTDLSPLFTMPKLKRANIGGLKVPESQVQRLKEQLGMGKVDNLDL